MSFKILSEEQIFKGKFIKVFATAFLDKAGVEQHWEWAQKKDIVVIFGITKENKVVLIKNYRVPSEKYIIDNPGGLIDETDATPEDAARRELREETGYVAEKYFALPKSPQAPGMSDQFFYPFIATGLTKVSDEHGDATEDIEVVEVPTDELVAYYLQTLEKDIAFNVRVLGLYSVAQSMGLVR